MSSHADRPSENPSGFPAAMRIDQPHVTNQPPLHLGPARGAMQPAGVIEPEPSNEISVGVADSLEQLREHAAQLADRLQSDMKAIQSTIQTELAAMRDSSTAGSVATRRTLDDLRSQFDDTKTRFAADTLLAKHDERYMPKEVVDALKKQGRWQEGTTAATK